MRHIVGQSVAHVLVACVDQQIHRMRADRAAGERIVLPRQTEPAGRPLSGRARQNVGRQIEPRLLVRRAKSADILMLQSVRRDLMTFGDQRAQPLGAQLRDDGRHSRTSP